MKLLLLLTLLTAGTTAHSISCQALRQFNDVVKCTLIHRHAVLVENDYYDSFCGSRDSDSVLDRCCETHDNCYSQVMKMENCKSLIDNPCTSSYSFSCSKNVVTCSEANNSCESFICKCDHEAAICFFQSLFNKEF